MPPQQLSKLGPKDMRIYRREGGEGRGTSKE